MDDMKLVFTWGPSSVDSDLLASRGVCGEEGEAEATDRSLSSPAATPASAGYQEVCSTFLPSLKQRWCFLS